MLRGEKIFLRPLEIADANEKYLSWLHDPEVMAGIATSGYSLDSLKEYVKAKVSDPHVAFYAICDVKSGEHIGNVKLDFHDKKSNVSEFGMLIGNKEFWGKGIGAEACRLMLHFGFEQLKLRKIYLAVYEENPAARRVYEKVGFQLEGTLRKHVFSNGRHQDKYLMGIFSNELK